MPSDNHEVLQQLLELGYIRRRHISTTRSTSRRAYCRGAAGVIGDREETMSRRSVAVVTAMLLMAIVPGATAVARSGVGRPEVSVAAGPAVSMPVRGMAPSAPTARRL